MIARGNKAHMGIVCYGGAWGRAIICWDPSRVEVAIGEPVLAGEFDFCPSVCVGQCERNIIAAVRKHTGGLESNFRITNRVRGAGVFTCRWGAWSRQGLGWRGDGRGCSYYVAATRQTHSQAQTRRNQNYCQYLPSHMVISFLPRLFAFPGSPSPQNTAIRRRQRGWEKHLKHFFPSLGRLVKRKRTFKNAVIGCVFH